MERRRAQAIHRGLHCEGYEGRGSAGFVPPAERIAVFDNDGTLWAEQAVHHTDAEREWAYDRKSSIGRLDKALEAQAKGWTIVDMKNDWKRVFAFENK